MLNHKDVNELLKALSLDKRRGFDYNLNYTNIWDFGKDQDNTLSGVDTEVNESIFDAFLRQ